jgi:hypothetical protein
MRGSWLRRLRRLRLRISLRLRLGLRLQIRALPRQLWNK